MKILTLEQKLVRQRLTTIGSLMVLLSLTSPIATLNAETQVAVQPTPQAAPGAPNPLTAAVGQIAGQALRSMGNATEYSVNRSLTPGSAHAIGSEHIQQTAFLTQNLNDLQQKVGANQVQLTAAQQKVQLRQQLETTLANLTKSIPAATKKNVADKKKNKQHPSKKLKAAIKKRTKQLKIFKIQKQQVTSQLSMLNTDPASLPATLATLQQEHDELQKQINSVQSQINELNQKAVHSKSVVLPNGASLPVVPVTKQSYTRIMPPAGTPSTGYSEYYRNKATSQASNPALVQKIKARLNDPFYYQGKTSIDALMDQYIVALADGDTQKAAALNAQITAMAQHLAAAGTAALPMDQQNAKTEVSGVMHAAEAVAVQAAAAAAKQAIQSPQAVASAASTVAGAIGSVGSFFKGKLKGQPNAQQELKSIPMEVQSAQLIQFPAGYNLATPLPLGADQEAKIIRGGEYAGIQGWAAINPDTLLELGMEDGASLKSQDDIQKALEDFFWAAVNHPNSVHLPAILSDPISLEGKSAAYYLFFRAVWAQKGDAASTASKTLTMTAATTLALLSKSIFDALPELWERRLADIVAGKEHSIAALPLVMTDATVPSVVDGSITLYGASLFGPVQPSTDGSLFRFSPDVALSFEELKKALMLFASSNVASEGPQAEQRLDTPYASYFKAGTQVGQLKKPSMLVFLRDLLLHYERLQSQGKDDLIVLIAHVLRKAGVVKEPAAVQLAATSPADLHSSVVGAMPGTSPLSSASPPSHPGGLTSAAPASDNTGKPLGGAVGALAARFSQNQDTAGRPALQPSVPRPLDPARMNAAAAVVGAQTAQSPAPGSMSSQPTIGKLDPSRMNAAAAVVGAQTAQSPAPGGVSSQPTIGKLDPARMSAAAAVVGAQTAAQREASTSPGSLAKESVPQSVGKLSGDHMAIGDSLGKLYKAPGSTLPSSSTTAASQPPGRVVVSANAPPPPALKAPASTTGAAPARAVVRAGAPPAPPAPPALKAPASTTGAAPVGAVVSTAPPPPPTRSGAAPARAGGSASAPTAVPVPRVVVAPRQVPPPPPPPPATRPSAAPTGAAVSAAAPPARPVASGAPEDDRQALLAQIQGGVQLKRAADRQLPPAPPKALTPRDEIAQRLQANFRQRTGQAADSDSDWED